jgi:hypothetical protein
MNLIRFILISVIFYLILRSIINVFNILAGKKKNDDTNTRYNRNPKQNKYKIAKDDVIEANFEEIENADKPKEKS